MREGGGRRKGTGEGGMEGEEGRREGRVKGRRECEEESIPTNFMCIINSCRELPRWGADSADAPDPSVVTGERPRPPPVPTTSTASAIPHKTTVVVPSKKGECTLTPV